ncbi:endonuclease [Flavobacterium sp.]|uniref:endonuclease n=1 Tax=Flavobacterium sp. TaxID=239 RepID=UPI00120D5B28|nr:endonuclease [Flavobacterium sp.]RZJ70705.1 MAG: T9SS type A sorting domain-containing protein [Flavobacterium sp.]
MFKNTLGFLLLLCSFSSFSQVVINELDSDTPSTDDKEFVELKSNVPNFPLDGYVLVFYNGATNSNRSYFVLDLDGLITDANGIVHIGNQLVAPVPARIFSNSVIQNGADGVALYVGNGSDFPNNTIAHSNNLISALIYGNNNPDATTLMSLLGVSVQYNEAANGLGTTQSLQRKADGTYEAKAPTPGENNDGSGIVFNGLTASSNITYEIAEGASMTLTFSTQTPVTSALTFTFSFEGTTFSTADFTGNTTLTIPTGATTATTQITIVDDNLDEGDEVFRLKFGTLPTGYVRMNDNLPFIVIDNDFTTATYGTPLNPTYGLVTPGIPAGYYDSLEGKAGVELKQAIQAIIANPNVVRAQNYGDIQYMLQDADQNPLNSNQVWLMYVEQPRGKYKFQSTASNTGSWNREHIFPQSRGGFSDGTSSQADGINVWLPTGPGDILAGHADGHHIRAEDGPENSSRNNRDYGSDYNGPAGNQGSWKGDVARALFYMAVRYNGLNLVVGNPDDTTGNQVMGDLISLLAWNHSDPADDFEMHHNNVIYNWQLNRNPFVDYPDLADYVYGQFAGASWHAPLSTPSPEKPKVALYPNPSKNQFRLSGIETASIEIFSVAGMKVMEAQVSGTDAVNFDLKTGMYLVKVLSDGKATTLKLVVK